MRKERGELNVIQVCTYGTEGTRSAISAACFKKGTLVKTREGEKPIELITSNDEVYTVNGWEKVIAPTITDGKTLINFKMRYSTNLNLECTPEHEILCLERNNHKGRINGVWNKEKTFSLFPQLKELKATSSIYQKYYNYCKEIQPIWKQAKDFNCQDYALQKIDMSINENSYIEWKNETMRKYGYGLPEKIKIDENFCELLGIWLAEGSCNGQSICFTIHQNEGCLKNRILQLMWQVFQLDNFQTHSRNDSLALNISFASKQLVKFFSQLFNVNSITEINQWNKHVPTCLLHINPQLQLQIFKGWFLGDGYARTPRYGIRQSSEAKGTTVSKQLADDMIFILRRNFINPTIISEHRKNRRRAYNVQLYSKKAEKLYEIKYEYKNYNAPLYFNLEDRNNMDFPVYYNDNFYLRAKIEKLEEMNINEPVYCLMTPSQTFTINDIIVHNCRGYRSEFYPNGIDVDTTLYLTSLIPQERGFLWPLHDAYYGNEEKDRKPILSFINELDKYPGLFEIIESIEGLVCKRGQHASGVILYNDNPFETGAIMRSPNGDLTTQYSLHEAEMLGDVKYDFLVTEICDKITAAVQLLQTDNLIESNLSLREVYNKYLHPDKLDINDNELWDALSEGKVLDVFQFSTGVGLATAKQIKPHSIDQMVSANALMRLMGEAGKERPIDRYCRLKQNMDIWYQECKDAGLTKEEIKILEPYYLPNFGVPASQEDLMMVCLDENIAHFTLKEANAARKTVAKKKINEVPILREKFINQCPTKNLGKYVWETVMEPQMSYA